MADELLRIKVFGQSGVGKTSLVLGYVMDFALMADWDPTIEQAYIKNTNVDGSRLLLEIDDFKGSNDGQSLLEAWIGQGQGFLLVYAVDSPSSFEYVQTLRDTILKIKETSDVPIVLVGNKCDLSSGDKPKISKQEGEELASQWKVPFLETSAKSRINVDESFIQLAREIKKKQKTKESEKSKDTKSCKVQ
jgi:small GTP-binding protein